MDRTAYLDALVSQPWARDNNCWHFVQRVRKELFGKDDLPFIPDRLIDDLPGRKFMFESHPARAQWVEMDHPQDGDVIVMTRGHELHFGIFIKELGTPGFVWHSDQPHGVVSETLLEVRLRRWSPRIFRYRP